MMLAGATACCKHGCSHASMPWALPGVGKTAVYTEVIMQHVHTGGRLFDLSADDMDALGYSLSTAMHTKDIDGIRLACAGMDYTGPMPGVVLNCASPFDADIGAGQKTFDARVTRWYGVTDGGMVDPNVVQYEAHDIARIGEGDIITFETTGFIGMPSTTPGSFDLTCSIIISSPW